MPRHTPIADRTFSQWNTFVRCLPTEKLMCFYCYSPPLPLCSDDSSFRTHRHRTKVTAEYKKYATQKKKVNNHKWNSRQQRARGKHITICSRV